MKKLFITLSVILALFAGILAGINIVIRSPQWVKVYHDHYEIITSVFGHEFISESK